MFSRVLAISGRETRAAHRSAGKPRLVSQHGQLGIETVDWMAFTRAEQIERIGVAARRGLDGILAVPALDHDRGRKIC